jgi:cysteine dioxygenase
MTLNAALYESARRHDKRARLAKPMDRDLRDRVPAALRSLIELVKAPGAPDLDAIAIAMQTLDIDEEALGDAVYRDENAYVRTLVYRDTRAELLVLTWLAGQRSPVHDHGPAEGLVRIVAGEATENLYRCRESGAAKRELMSRTLRPGIVSRLGGGMLHSLGNDTPETTLVTLHLYVPPLQGHA